MKKALVVVDVQNDFCPDGALAVPTGDEIVPVLNQYIERFKRAGLPIIATRDWHPPRTKHFREQGGPWPPHCVQGTRGAEFHPDLRLPEDAIVVSKGMDPNEDAYSGYQARASDGTPFRDLLHRLGVDQLYIGGLATDYCVRYTTRDAQESGERVTVLLDAVRGIDVRPGDIERALAEIASAGGKFTTLADLKVEDEDPEAGD